MSAVSAGISILFQQCQEGVGSHSVPSRALQMWRMSGGQDEGRSSMWEWHVTPPKRGLSYMCQPQSGVNRVPWLPYHHEFYHKQAVCRLTSVSEGIQHNPCSSHMMTIVIIIPIETILVQNSNQCPSNLLIDHLPHTAWSKMTNDHKAWSRIKAWLGAYRVVTQTFLPEFSFPGQLTHEQLNFKILNSCVYYNH